MTTFNAGKLDKELREAGIPIDGCSSDGRVDFRPEATQEQRDLAEAIKAAHDPTDTDALKQEAAIAAVNAADIAAIKAGAAASGQSPLAQHVDALAQVVADLCEALGFTPTTE